MHLSSFGLISLDGSVAKPEPGLNFAKYQIAMAHYSAAIALRTRLKSRADGVLIAATETASVAVTTQCAPSALLAVAQRATAPCAAKLAAPPSPPLAALVPNVRRDR